MRDYPFSFERLFEFSCSNPYLVFNEQEKKLFDYLESKRVSLNFPAVLNDVGNLLSFLNTLIKPKVIFEFGSGYGHSAFWYLRDPKHIENIYLCEKRDDLLSVFEMAPWTKEERALMNYHQGDAFDKLSEIKKVDMLLIDGVKADYLKFLEESESKLSDDGVVIIDNSYWRGSFLDKEVSQKKLTAKKIKELHEYIKQSSTWTAVFLPFKDGVTVLKRL